ncbi:hypothetical protein BH24ACT5_BH24ACT5_25240 [soil metagenome]
MRPWAHDAVMADDPRRSVAALAAAQHSTFTRRQAATVGFDRRRVTTAKRAGWLVEPVSGVLALAEAPDTWHRRLMIVLLACGTHGVASHRAAARLHGLDGFDSARNATIEASVSRRFRLDPSVVAVTHHVTPLDAVDVAVIEGVRCTTVARTLADLGSVVRDDQAVRRALTSARRRGAVELAELRATAVRLHRPGQSGTGRLLRVLDQVPWEGRLPDSWFEELLALAVNDPSLPAAVAQCPIADAGGRVVARTDLGFPSVRLGLEGHSRAFHFGPDAGARYEDRDLAAARCGWELLYLGWHAAKRPAEVLTLVREVVSRRTRELRPGAA